MKNPNKPLFKAILRLLNLPYLRYKNKTIPPKSSTTISGYFKKCFAFTLGEMLVSLVILSIILVTLAPVITKRIVENIEVDVAASRRSEKLFTFDTTNPDCSAVSGQNALDCNFKTGSGVKKVNIIMVSGGGGGAGATNPYYEYGKKDSSTGTQKTIEITNGLKNVKVNYLSGSGGGGGGGAWSESAGGAPTSQADCDKYDAKFLTAAQNNGTPVCVTKWNIGDIPNAPNGGIASSVTTVSVNTNCSANACCWQGKTGGTCNSSGTSYSGCNRTVCTWYAGKASCQALAYNGTKAGDWRLPTSNEMYKWASNISTISRYQGDNGLRLCDYRSGYGAAQCDLYGVCDGSYYGNCYPNYVWSSTTGSSTYYDFTLSTGSFYQDYQYPRHADSVRCVLDSTGPTTTSLSGGGGSAAPYFKDYPIPQNIIDSNIGGQIVLSAPAGGSGGAAASSKGSSASNGNNGSDSYIAIYDKDGVLKWGLKASGGNGGKGASSSAGGAGGAQKAANTCQIYQNGAWTSTNCTGAGAKGTNGQSVSDANETTAAAGGNGGGSMYNTTSLSGAGTGGGASSVNGSNGSSYGAGGGGGTVGFDSSDNAKKGKGGNGASGIAEITYDLAYQAAAGGGGGGGAMLELKNISVTPSTTYTVRVGGGGGGGAVANNGIDGGESKITFGSTTYTLTGGKGGKAGTAASASSAVAHGAGGNGAPKLNVGTSVAGENGQNGSSGTIDSIGGCGGKSGTGGKGGCGALFTNGDNCTTLSTFGSSPTFLSPSSSFSASDYGSAGAGGGGGGYSFNTTTYPDNNPGYGGDGQGGYVYIYWIEYN